MKSIELFLTVGSATAVSFSSIGMVDANESNLNSDRLNTPIIVAEGEESGEGGEGDAELSPGEQANADFQDKMSGAELLILNYYA